MARCGEGDGAIARSASRDARAGGGGGWGGRTYSRDERKSGAGDAGWREKGAPGRGGRGTPLRGPAPAGATHERGAAARGPPGRHAPALAAALSCSLALRGAGGAAGRPGARRGGAGRPGAASEGLTARGPAAPPRRGRRPRRRAAAARARGGEPAGGQPTATRVPGPAPAAPSPGPCPQDSPPERAGAGAGARPPQSPTCRHARAAAHDRGGPGCGRGVGLRPAQARGGAAACAGAAAVTAGPLPELHSSKALTRSSQRGIRTALRAPASPFAVSARAPARAGPGAEPPPAMEDERTSKNASQVRFVVLESGDQARSPPRGTHAPRAAAGAPPAERRAPDHPSPRARPPRPPAGGHPCYFRC
jgi:hypothetical protein